MWWATGSRLRSEYAPLQRFIDDFWQRNQMDQRIPEWCDELCRAGEIFPVLFTNPQDRTSTVRCVPASIVERIEWREGDYEAELRYKEVGLRGAGGEERWWVSPRHAECRRSGHAGDAALRGQPAGRRAARGVGPGAHPALAQAVLALAGGPGAAECGGAGLSLGGEGAGAAAGRAGRTLPPAAGAGRR